LVETLFLQKMFDDLGKLIEGVFECRWIWGIAISKPGIVRRDNVKAVAERRDEISVRCDDEGQP